MRHVWLRSVTTAKPHRVPCWRRSVRSRRARSSLRRCSARSRPGCPSACSSTPARCSASARAPSGRRCGGWSRPASSRSATVATAWPARSWSVSSAWTRATRRSDGRGTARGSWPCVSAERRPAAPRSELRAAAGALRLMEVREGVWIRPDNLDPRRLPGQQAIVDAQCVRFSGARSAAGLASRLFDFDSVGGAGGRARGSDGPGRRQRRGRHRRSGPRLPPVGGRGAPPPERPAAARRAAPARLARRPAAPPVRAPRRVVQATPPAASLRVLRGFHGQKWP